MKTPREILLKRHQSVVPNLDAIRREVVNSKLRRGKPAAAIWNWPSLLWSELILPSRRIWAGLAAVWILILAANVSLRSGSSAVVAKFSPTPEMISSFRQQEKILTELIGQNESQIAEPPKGFLPRPSSGRRFGILMA